MKAVSFLVKPASGRCDLACSYCFYKDLAARRAEADRGFMSRETARALLDGAFALGAEAYSFGFQGGEPTLAGPAFFRDFAAYARKAAAAQGRRAGREPSIAFSIQTNGLSLDEEWAELLKAEGFLVGLSVDGPRSVHDARRRAPDGSPSWARAQRSAELLRAAGVPLNAVCTVDALGADNPELVWSSLRGRGFEWLQFIPCLDPPGEEGTHPWSLSAAAWGRFLKKTFDLWWTELGVGAGARVRWFDSLVELAAGGSPDGCGMAGACSSYYTVEADGSVYPCDFYASDAWRLGRVGESSLRAMAEGEVSRRFMESSLPVSAPCLSCFAYPLCRGGCRRWREPFADGLPGLNVLCAGYKDFFAHAGERLIALAAPLRRKG